MGMISQLRRESPLKNVGLSGQRQKKAGEDPGLDSGGGMFSGAQGHP